jgi:hypothetical protein
MWYLLGATPLLWFSLEGDHRSRSEHGLDRVGYDSEKLIQSVRGW